MTALIAAGVVVLAVAALAMVAHLIGRQSCRNMEHGSTQGTGPVWPEKRVVDPRDPDEGP